MGKEYILYGHGGSYNHGVEAITKCTIELLREIAPDSKILLSTHFPEQDREYGLDVDDMLERNLEGKTNAEVYRTTLEAITSNSVVIHIGGDNYCYNNWERYAEIHKNGIEKGAVSILWGCSIDEERMSEEMIAALSTHSLILAREPITYNALINRGLKNVRKVSDIAFSLKAKKVDIPEERYVVVNISPLVCRKNPNAEYAIEQLIKYILDNTAYSVVLLPHVMARVDNDYEQLSKYMNLDEERIYLVSDKLSASEYKYIVAHAQLCVAARTHVTIAAYSSSVPTIAIGYSTKARGIGLDLGLSEYVVNIEDEELEQSLLNCFKLLMENKESIRLQLEEKMKEYKQLVYNEEIINLLLGK